uniref:Uncharacterized protein n=1 Tax=Medicago truncatula TaxID=3880 RepID=B7FLZ3_MEDTR|nr:unknown [Medicago truncatula]AFK46316.1 unknown [Medicago truncatula]
MSPSMKSKSKSKAKAAKEQQKTSPKTSGSTNDESSIPSSACDLETSLVDSSSIVNDNSQFAKINETDDHSISPQGTVSEYDSVSNNGSCSGESEDTKEKAANSSTRLEFIPGCDNDRRDKIRLKNERKHQRQRERRAHELHERCVAYLMSRKLEKLVQKLVAMGFTTERATLRNNAGNRMASSYMTGSRNVGTAREISSSAGLRDWTSPFAGKDIFSAPRKFVTFPPM